VTVNSPTQLTASITIPATAATGARTVTVTNAAPGGGTSGGQTFTVNNPLPTLTSLAPATGDRLQTLDVVFTGTGFITGVSSVNVPAGVTVNSTTVDSPTQITANVTIGATTSTGALTMSVTNAAPGGGTSATQTFTVTNPVPTLASLSPVSGVQGQTGLQVVLTGTNFVPGSLPVFSGAGISLTGSTVDSPTQITATIDIAAGAPAVPDNVTVTTGGPGGGTSGAQTFTVNAPPAPTLSSIAPATGDRLQTLNVVFTGTNFVSGVSTIVTDPGFTVNSVTVNSSTQITANITVLATAALGANNFSVDNSPPGGTSAPQVFTVTNPAPTITNVAPSTVSVGLAGTTVNNTVITGTGFIAGTTVVDSPDGDVTVGAITVDSPTQITVSTIQYPGTLPLVTITRTLRVTNAPRAPATRTITLTP